MPFIKIIKSLFNSTSQTSNESTESSTFNLLKNKSADTSNAAKSNFPSYPIDKTNYKIQTVDAAVILHDIIRKNMKMQDKISYINKNEKIDAAKGHNNRIIVNTISHLNELDAINMDLNASRLIKFVKDLYVNDYLHDVISQYFKNNIMTNELPIYETLRTKGDITEQIAYIKNEWLPKINQELKSKIDKEVYSEFDILTNRILNQYDETKWSNDLIGYTLLDKLRASYVNRPDNKQWILTGVTHLKNMASIIDYTYVMSEYITNGSINYINNNELQNYYYQFRNAVIKQATKNINTLSRDHSDIAFKNPFDDMNLSTDILKDNHKRLSQLSEIKNLKVLYQHQINYDNEYQHDAKYWKDNEKVNPYPYFKTR